MTKLDNLSLEAMRKRKDDYHHYHQYRSLLLAQTDRQRLLDHIDYLNDQLRKAKTEGLPGIR